MPRLIHTAAHPFHAISDRLLTTHKGRVAFRLGSGTTLIFIGAFMATHPIEGIAHFIWEGTAYSIHAFGTVPIIAHLANFLPLILKD